MYVCIFREKEIRLRTFVRSFVRLLNGPARGGKLIIYNRGTGGDQWVKELEWEMQRKGQCLKDSSNHCPSLWCLSVVTNRVG